MPEARLTEERCLLVAGRAGDRDACAEELRLADRPARADDLGEHGARDAEELEQLVVPVERREVEEQRSRGVGDVGRVHGPAGQLPDEPRVDRPEGEVARGLAEDPLELRRREVRVRDEPRPVADEVGGELLAALGRAPVLPDDGAVGRLAARPIPDDRRLALVRDADRGEIGRRRARLLQRLAGGRKHGLPELVRVLLDPPGPRIVLRHLAVAAPLRPQGFVEDEAGRARRPLVDSQDHGYRGSSKACSTSMGANPWRLYSRSAGRLSASTESPSVSPGWCDQ